MSSVVSLSLWLFRHVGICWNSGISEFGGVEIHECISLYIWNFRCLFACPVYLQALHPQGKNLETDEFEDISKMITNNNWEMGPLGEYRNNMKQPAFLDEPGIPIASSSTMVKASATPEFNDECTTEQIASVTKMVAWFKFIL